MSSNGYVFRELTHTQFRQTGIAKKARRSRRPPRTGRSTLLHAAASVGADLPRRSRPSQRLMWAMLLVMAPGYAAPRNNIARVMGTREVPGWSNFNAPFLLRGFQQWRRPAALPQDARGMNPHDFCDSRAL